VTHKWLQRQAELPCSVPLPGVMVGQWETGLTSFHSYSLYLKTPATPFPLAKFVLLLPLLWACRGSMPGAYLSADPGSCFPDGSW
jgi:hypothetical protein